MHPHSHRTRRLSSFYACAAVALCLGLAACATSPTRFASTWVDHSYSGPPVEPVAVLALFKSEAVSRNFETQATQLLKERGIQAVAARSVLAPDRQYTQQQMTQQLRQADVGGVLVFRLIGEDKRHQYINPTPYLGPVPPNVLWGSPYYWYYYPNWNYYWFWRSSRDVTRSPGYWTAATYYVIESSLYSNKTQRLLWTAKSETLDGNRLEGITDSVANRVTNQLVDLGFLKSGNAYASADKTVKGRRNKQNAG
ncbi:MAG TPA: hypothetical protein VFY39_16285 [Gammaproteobacteria bacterium]|nr:hypothetical protein [Gammaproteobacteria bacterium]